MYNKIYEVYGTSKICIKAVFEDDGSDINEQALNALKRTFSLRRHIKENEEVYICLNEVTEGSIRRIYN